ncbi:MAG: hypothetical protein R2816_00435 [Flavobacteriaceae bacterium]|nr:hypothetical protein [Flavobacteriaceae bacterium]
MIKKILELKGAQQLSKKEQNAINGGANNCESEFQCLSHCISGDCYSFPVDPGNGPIIHCWSCRDQDQ